jgi:hypothetical protein
MGSLEAISSVRPRATDTPSATAGALPKASAKSGPSMQRALIASGGDAIARAAPVASAVASEAPTQVVPPAAPPKEGLKDSTLAYGKVAVAAQVALAPAVLFLQWGVEPLVRLAGKLVEGLHLDALERRIAKLPPYAALLTFGAPALTLIPVKIGSLHLLASGHAAVGVAVLIGAKVVGTAVVGRLFTLTKPKLMQIGWFAKAYNKWMPWRDAMMDRVHHSRIYRFGRFTGRQTLRAVNAWFGGFKSA